CELTIIGNMLAEKIEPVLNILDFFDEQNDYWGTHNLNVIPPHLLKRISEIGTYTMFETPLSEMFEINKAFEEGFRRSTYVAIFATVLYPTTLELIKEKEIDVEYITTPEVIEKIRTKQYEQFSELIESYHIKFFQYNKEINFPAFALIDDGFFLIMPRKDRNFENIVLMANSPGALAWGRELFEYYQNDSTLINSLEHPDNS
ncbi:MAG: DUF1724 domain-containing protein, partial [Desulfobacterales bacterium]|nr:DUF1724 domain-containing protein [Desulfobacterales bacterium]